MLLVLGDEGTKLNRRATTSAGRVDACRGCNMHTVGAWQEPGSDPCANHADQPLNVLVKARENQSPPLQYSGVSVRERPESLNSIFSPTQPPEPHLNINIEKKGQSHINTERKMDKPSLNLAALSTDPDGAYPVPQASQSPKYDVLSGGSSFFKSVQW